MGPVQGRGPVGVSDTGDTGDALAPVAGRVLHYLVSRLVDDATGVTIEEVAQRRGTLLEVRVGEGDMGRVIGRRGRTAGSIRSVVAAAATRDGVAVDVDFVD